MVNSTQIDSEKMTRKSSIAQNLKWESKSYLKPTNLARVFMGTFSRALFDPIMHDRIELLTYTFPYIVELVRTMKRCALAESHSSSLSACALVFCGKRLTKASQADIQTILDSSPENTLACPIKRPEIGDECDAAKLTDYHCHYSGVMCEGYNKPQGYEYICSCQKSDNTFMCDSVLVNCPNPPPSLLSDSVVVPLIMMNPSNNNNFVGDDNVATSPPTLFAQKEPSITGNTTNSNNDTSNVGNTAWLLSPLLSAWICTRIFKLFFHPRFSQPFLTTTGKKDKAKPSNDNDNLEIGENEPTAQKNPYLNQRYAASSDTKQKDAFIKLVRVCTFTSILFIFLPIVLNENNDILHEEIKISPAVKCGASALTAAYLLDLLFKDMDDYLMVCHHIATISAATCALNDGTLVPINLFFFRTVSLTFLDGPGDLISFLYRFDIGDAVRLQTGRFYGYIVASLATFALDWLYALCLYKGDNFSFIVTLIIIWEVTDLRTIKRLRDLVKFVTRKEDERRSKAKSKLFWKL